MLQNQHYNPQHSTPKKKHADDADDPSENEKDGENTFQGYILTHFQLSIFVFDFRIPLSVSEYVWSNNWADTLTTTQGLRVNNTPIADQRSVEQGEFETSIQSLLHGFLGRERWRSTVAHSTMKLQIPLSGAVQAIRPNHLGL
jgi:hypothetical protein